MPTRYRYLDHGPNVLSYKARYSGRLTTRLRKATTDEKRTRRPAKARYVRNLLSYKPLKPTLWRTLSKPYLPRNRWLLACLPARLCRLLYGMTHLLFYASSMSLAPACLCNVNVQTTQACQNSLST